MTNLEQRCLDKIEAAFVECEIQYKRKLQRVPVEFSTRMTSSAGYAYWNQDGSPKVIRLSKSILKANGINFVNDTPGHEAAHIIAVEIYGKKAGNHGVHWQEVMKIIGLEPEVTHSFVTPKKRAFQYRSACGQVKELTVIRHNKLQRSKVEFYVWPKDEVRVYKNDFIGEV